MRCLLGFWKIVGMGVGKNLQTFSNLFFVLCGFLKEILRYIIDLIDVQDVGMFLEQTRSCEEASMHTMVEVCVV